MKIIDYAIVDIPNGSTEFVNDLIQNGWQPWGVATNSYGFIIQQAMVKYEEEEQIPDDLNLPDSFKKIVGLND